ncbi:hypothetical protein B0T19DRAFT_255675 [Cercophora scortea]|uniref:Secreted protein n=1 Tax=Cercophora scortea TaxID=314031 RepID=A0AAE0I9L7_9PEZI|nr:hypothetical protein B0T19DRAFT_255675 [Cercophora scortea]
MLNTGRHCHSLWPRPVAWACIWVACETICQLAVTEVGSPGRPSRWGEGARDKPGVHLPACLTVPGYLSVTALPINDSAPSLHKPAPEAMYSWRCMACVIKCLSISSWENSS